MKTPEAGRGRHSIFLKISYIILAATVLIIALFGISFYRMFTKNLYMMLDDKFINYADYILEGLGEPVDYEKTKEVADELALWIGIITGREYWTSSSQFPGRDELERNILQKNRSTGLYKGRFFIIKERQNSTYIFISNIRGFVAVQFIRLIWVFAFLLLILYCIYFFIRRILKPITYLKEAVIEVGKGNFAHKIDLVSNDELGELSQLFNDLTGEVKNMIYAKKQLLLDISHELRSPLARLKFLIELIDDEKIKSQCHDEVNDMDSMIYEILETERLDNPRYVPEKEPINIYDEVLYCIEKNRYPYSHHDLFGLPADLTIRGDKRLIRILLKNILENAHRYSDPAHKPIRISGYSDHKSITITIKDYGQGMDEKELAYIFEPFYRTDRSRRREAGGYGLGLSLCKKIMKIHGGRITVKSARETGTAIILHFTDRE